MGSYKIMTKNFEINDILNAVKSIFTIKRNIGKEERLKSNSSYNSNILPSIDQIKFYKS